MEKNKIIVDSFKSSIGNDEPIFLEIDSITKLEFLVKENVNSKLMIIGNKSYDISIKLEKNSSLLVNSLNKDNSVNVNVSLMENSTINYFHSVLADNDSINKFDINHFDDSSSSYLRNSGINRKDNKLYFDINGVVPKKLHNIVCDQDSKIINFKNGNSKIIPNLIIDSNDIIASHSAYIGEILEEELFYMKSRGISEEDIKKMIYKGVLLGRLYLEDSEKEEFNKIINEWW